MDTIGTRIALVRKKLNLTQREFSLKLGLARNTIAAYETNIREPLHAVIVSICREYNINEEWLLNGTGDIFVELLEEDEYFKAASELSKNKDEFAMRIVVEYWKLDKERKKMFKDFIYKIAEQSKNEE